MIFFFIFIAVPKSINLIVKFYISDYDSVSLSWFNITIFYSLRSRWTIFKRCIYVKAERICLIIFLTSFSLYFFLFIINYTIEPPVQNYVTTWNIFFSSYISNSLIILGWSNIDSVSISIISYFFFFYDMIFCLIDLIALI